MKATRRKLLSTLLALVMVLGLVPGMALTAGAAATPVSNEEELTAALAVGGEIELADDIDLTSTTMNIIADTDLQDTAAWYYLDMVEATNAHDFTITDGVETWK